MRDRRGGGPPILKIPQPPGHPPRGQRDRRTTPRGGGIRLSKASGSLRATTAVGNVIAELLAGGTPEDSMLVTGLGDITIFVPSNLGIRILARIDSGGAKRIVSDFPGVKTKVNGPM